MMLPGSIDALNPQPGKVSPNRLPFFAKWKGKHVWSLQPMVVPISHLEFNSPKTINLTGFKSKIHNGDYDPRQGSKMSHLSTYKQIHTHIVTIQDVYIYICVYIYIYPCNHITRYAKKQLTITYSKATRQVPLRMSCHNPPEDAAARRQGLVPSPTDLDLCWEVRLVVPHD